MVYGYLAKLFFTELCEYTHNRIGFAVIVKSMEAIKHLKNEYNVIANWSDPYLNTLEALYGDFNLYPTLTIQELSDEWKECFRADGQGQSDSERIKLAAEWCKSYLSTLENLYGEFNLHPPLTIQELCEEWEQLFMSNSEEQRDRLFK